jgi:hypothetical protein
VCKKEKLGAKKGVYETFFVFYTSHQKYWFLAELVVRI